MNFIERVPKAEIKRLCPSASVLEYSHKSTIYSEGDVIRSVYCLMDGQIALSKISHDGRIVTIDLLMRGDFLSSALSGIFRVQNSATAKGAVSVWKSPVEEFNQLLLHHPIMSKAYLEITLVIPAEDRAGAGAVYAKYKEPFLSTITGARSKELLLREEDVQVLHGFDSRTHAEGYLGSALFNTDVVNELKPFLRAEPEVRIYESA